MSATPLDAILQGELAVRVFEESNDAFVVFNPKSGLIVEINATALRLTDLRRRGLVDQPLRSVVFSDQDHGLKALLAETSESGFYQARDGYFLSDGDERRVPVSITVSRLHVEPEPLALIVARDMTRRRQLQQGMRELERQLELNRRLASLGELVATFAHELRQPLCAIANFASVAGTLQERGEFDQLSKTLQRISAESMRSSEVVTQIQSFVRAQPPETVDVDINSTVQETLSYLQPETSRGAIRVTTKLTNESATGVCNPIQLQEVIINLVRNALEACARAGLDEPRVAISTDISPVYVTITVSDNGPGISNEIRNRLFQPFATSRSDGMGMGLAICRRMMTAICGRLELRKSTSKGATFVVSIPRAGVKQGDTSF